MYQNQKGSEPKEEVSKGGFMFHFPSTALFNTAFT
jgi:hypothetical protein